MVPMASHVLGFFPDADGARELLHELGPLPEGLFVPVRRVGLVEHDVGQDETREEYLHLVAQAEEDDARVEHLEGDMMATTLRSTPPLPPDIAVPPMIVAEMTYMREFSPSLSVAAVETSTETTPPMAAVTPESTKAAMI